MFQIIPHAGDDDGSPHAGKHTSSKPKSSRRKDRTQQKPVSASKPATEVVQQRSGAAADAGEDASESLEEEDEEENEAQGDNDDSAVSSDSENDSDGTATSSADDQSDIASDLDGLPVAAVVGTTDQSTKQQKKKPKASHSQVITEAGMASKLGVAFSRVLERSSKHGIMQVRWSMSPVPGPQPLARPCTTIALYLLSKVYGCAGKQVGAKTQTRGGGRSCSKQAGQARAPGAEETRACSSPVERTGSRA